MNKMENKPEFKKLEDFMCSVEIQTEYNIRDLNQITTGNLSHHKAAILGRERYLKESYEEVKELLEIYKQELIQKWLKAGIPE